MSRLAQLQDEMQRAILAGDDTILAHIPDSPKETRGVLLGVYRNAYLLRLTDVLRNDHAVLHVYLGDDAFDELARDYVAALPSRTPNARWVSQELPRYLADTEPFSNHAEVAELAGIEKALNDAFDAADGHVLRQPDLAAIPPESWPALTFVPHPSARTLSLSTNALAIWTALAGEEEPPAAELLDEPQTVVAWRGDETPLVRALPAEEAMVWREAGKGVRFSVLCEMLATFDDPATAALRAASYLRGWLAAGQLTAATSV